MKSFFISSVVMAASLLATEEEKEPLLLQGITLFSEGSFDCEQCESGIHIQNLTIPGGEEKLKEQLDLFLDQHLVLDSRCIQEIKTRLSRYFRDMGYPLVAVEIPEQDVTDGIVRAVVVEGKLGKVITRGNRWFPSKMLTDQIRQKPGDKIDTNVLLEDVAWLNQTPFRFSDIVFAPGENPGTTDIELVTVDRFPARFYAGVDNTGTTITDNIRLFTGVEWAMTFGFDQTLSYQFTTAPDFHKFVASNVNYTAYLPWHHTLMIYGGYASTNPHISGFKSSGYNGQASLRYQVPISQAISNFFLQPMGGYDFKIENSDLLFAGEAQLATKGLGIISQFVGGLDVGWEQDRHKAEGQFLAFISPGDWLPHQSRAEYGMLRPGASALYLYSLLTMSYRYVNQVTMWLQMRLQGSTTPLLASEQFGLGGYDTVRGYQEREIISDNAACINAEVRAPTLSIKKGLDKWIFLWFVDFGYGLNDNGSQAEPRSVILASTGPGLRFAINTYVTFRADYGFKFHKIPNLQDTAPGRFHFGAIASY